MEKEKMAELRLQGSQAGKLYHLTREMVLDCRKGKMVRHCFICKRKREAQNVVSLIKSHAKAIGLAINVAERVNKFGGVIRKRIDISFTGGSFITIEPFEQD